jgi:retron-type reverse transcriptase
VALEANLQDWAARIKRGACRASPVRRAYIPKADGRQRPLGVPTLEVKIVQRAVVEGLNAIYEQDVLGFSYGFRPKRIQKWLRAGVLEDGERRRSEVGTVQGGSIRPLLANVYLHDVFDLWVQRWRQRQARGDTVVVRFADAFVVGFEHREEADRFLAELRERFAQDGLTLHPDKTRLIEFGRSAARKRRDRGDGKPETFNFLAAHTRAARLGRDGSRRCGRRGARGGRPSCAR